VPDYTVSFARSARKELEALPKSTAERILVKIEGLIATPRPIGTLKLRGQKNLWRIRVGEYRVVYAIDDISESIDISVIRHRRDVYRNL
jgi:mRNA interferase RelE/StbE